MTRQTKADLQARIERLELQLRTLLELAESGTLTPDHPRIAIVRRVLAGEQRTMSVVLNTTTSSYVVTDSDGDYEAETEVAALWMDVINGMVEAQGHAPITWSDPTIIRDHDEMEVKP